MGHAVGTSLSRRWTIADYCGPVGLGVLEGPQTSTDGIVTSETHSGERSGIRVAVCQGRIVLEVGGRARRIRDTAHFLVPVLNRSTSTLESTS